MFVLPKGTLVHFGGAPFRLLADVETDGLEENYNIVVETLANEIRAIRNIVCNINYS